MVELRVCRGKYVIMHWEVDAVFDIIPISESFNYDIVRLTSNG